MTSRLTVSAAALATYASDVTVNMSAIVLDGEIGFSLPLELELELELETGPGRK